MSEQQEQPEQPSAEVVASASAAAASVAAAAAAAAAVDSWLYITAGGEQKGPLPGGPLLRMVELGALKQETMVWRQGEANWVALYQSPDLQQRAALVRSQFYVATSELGGRSGPFNLSDLRRRFGDGECDGMSPVWYSADSASQWRTVGEVDGLRSLLLGNQDGDDDDEDAELQVFEREEQPALPVEEKKKSFVGDDGRRFGWDGTEWVEVEGDDDDDDEEQEGEKIEEVEEKTEADELKKAEKKKKRDRQKLKRKNKTWDKDSAKCWIYVEGLPGDATHEELKDHFSKVGVIALDSETAEPKIKIYQDDEGTSKGDASICFAKTGSVDLALQILDGGSLRFDTPLKVTRAEFQSRLGAFDESKRRRVNMAKVLLNKKAQAQEMQWANDEDSGASTASALRIIVVKNCFAPEELADEDPKVEEKLTNELRTALVDAIEMHEPPEKMTIFAKHHEGVIILKYKTPGEASEAIKKCEGLLFRAKRTLKSHFWDGVTDYTIAAKRAAEEEDVSRIEKFGDWLDDQELPPELQLQVEK